MISSELLLCDFTQDSKKKLKYNRTFKPQSEYFVGGRNISVAHTRVRLRNLSPDMIWAYNITAQRYNRTKDKANIFHPRSHEG